MSGSFTHLHVHTEFSMLDGASRLDDLVAAAAADGQPALGITDHGNMYGVLDFYKSCNKAGIKPIIGTEAYMAHEHRSERLSRRGRMDDSGGSTDGGKKLYYHLILLAENNTGYKNMIQLASESFMTGYHYKPRCLTAGQEIVTPTGMTPIEQLNEGDLVLTHNGRFRPVVQTMKRWHSGEIYGVNLSGRYGRTTWMTGEHPVLVNDSEGHKSWIEVQDLKAGRPSATENVQNWKSWACLPKVERENPVVEIDVADHVVDWQLGSQPGTFVRESQRREMGPTRHCASFPETIKLDEDFGWFVGLYLAEGYATRNEVRFTVDKYEIDTQERASEFIRRLTGKLPAVRGRADRVDYNSVDIRISSSVLSEFLTSLCNTGAANKQMPSFVWDAPEGFQRGLIQGLFDGDGARHDSGTIFTQTSENLSWQVRTLRAGLSEDFASVETWADPFYVYKPISSVETKQFDGWVYNIEVEDDHSYVSDFAIHNCDWELLDKYSEGIIATTGCLGGQVLQALLAGNFDEAVNRAGRLQDIFGRDNLFIELQDHGIPEQIRTNPQLLEIAKKIGAPILATNDSHYTHQADHSAHDALLCVQTGSLRSDPDRFKFHGDQHYLKSAAEMRHMWREVEIACDNSLWIADRCNVEIEFGEPQLPSFPLPEGFTDDDEYLLHLTLEGAKKRWGDSIPEEARERLLFELDVIKTMGFSSYFIITWDLIKHARDKGIRVGPGRGSAAGCAVAYCLWITDLDPIKYDLLFERFLNPSRISMPDIDMDFDSRYRDEMIRYCAERYGRDHVAQIVTFSQIKARAAVRDAARVLGFPYAVGDKVAKAMPPLIMGRDTPLQYCFEKHPKYEGGYAQAGDLREMVATDPTVAEVVEVAKGLEGLRRSDGIHAAAVVITKDPLTDYLPIQRKPVAGLDIEDSPVVTQYEMNGVEELGLLKMDFLGLRNLDVIDDTLKMIKANHGVDLDIDNVDLDDDETYALLQRGDTIGVFQLESTPMRALMKSLGPTSFDDVAALVALYRPGPMEANMHNDYADRKNGRQEVSLLHEDAGEILEGTYGLMIYQESMMRVAQKFAGYSLADADSLRKACGKKIREVMQKEKAKFVDGCETTGYGRPLGEEWWKIIEPFADYAFNKSHSYGYGLVAYQIAYLKAHYPVEYLAALLTSVKSSLDKAAIYLNECRVMGINVVVPDINRALIDFNPEPDLSGKTRGEIVFGMSAVRNVGEGLVEQIISERDANGLFESFLNFVERVDYSVLNKRTIESLIKAGAFDSLGHPRKGLLNVYEPIIDLTVASRKDHDIGVSTLFGSLGDEPSFDDRPDIPDIEFEKMPKLANEKEMLGLYISDHPILGYEAALQRRCDKTVGALEDEKDGAFLRVGGVITNLQKKWTRKGDLMAIFELEDLEGSIEVMVFPRTMNEHGHKLVDDSIVVVRGRLDGSGDIAKFICQDIEQFDSSQKTEGTPLNLRLPTHAQDPGTLDSLKSLLEEHSGQSDVFLHLDGKQVIRLPETYRVETGTGLVAELRVLLGPDAVLV